MRLKKEYSGDQFVKCWTTGASQRPSIALHKQIHMVEIFKVGLIVFTISGTYISLIFFFPGAFWKF